MLYQQLTDHCTAPGVDALLAQLAPLHKKLVAREYAGANALLKLPVETSDLAEIEALAKSIREKFKYVVVAGAGGSGLSGHTLLQFKPALSPVLHFMENVDPDVMEQTLARIDLAKTCFIIISKSGTTLETLSQFYVLLAEVKTKLGAAAARDQFILITIPGDNPLRAAAKEYGMRVLDHDPNVGGRFSILSVVGLLPAAIAGINIRALRNGAAQVIKQMDKADSAACEPALGAAIQVALSRNGYPINVMLPYVQRLAGFSSWYRQGWAESLGKNGTGSTPIRAVGTTDQHSQLQLYLDGPKDKCFHMIMLDRVGTGQAIPVPERKELDYMRGKTMGDIIAAEQEATFETLIHNRCPVRLFRLKKLDEEEMGALLMHFMLEILFAAELFGVNPFDQPAVEEGKKLAYEYLMKGAL